MLGQEYRTVCQTQLQGSNKKVLLLNRVVNKSKVPMKWKNDNSSKPCKWLSRFIIELRIEFTDCRLLYSQIKQQDQSTLDDVTRWTLVKKQIGSLQSSNRTKNKHHYFFPVQNPEKSCTLIVCCPVQFFTIWTAHLDCSRQHYNFELILLQN